MKYWIIDAFTEKPFKGNPAGVCLVEDFPLDSICLSIASEINLSETAFVKPIDERRFHIRWFAPHTEVKLCGHGTLASSHVLWEEQKISPQEISFESLSGPLFVTREGQRERSPYHTKGMYDPNRGPSQIILNFPRQDPKPLGIVSDILQKIFPDQIIATAIFSDDLLLELKDEDAIRNFSPDFETLKQLPYRAIMITARANPNSGFDFISRFFVPKGRIQEDPVTGAAHCKLAPYWANKIGKKELRAYQASKRGGSLKLTITNDRVLISGSAITVMHGEFAITL